MDHITGRGDLLYGAGADGRMRAVRLTTPSDTRWSAPMGGRAQALPVAVGGGVYVLVGGRLVALDA